MFMWFQALLSATFILQPSADVTFSTFLDCAERVYDYARHVSNWGDPLLPQPSGCPGLVSDDPNFQDGEHKWNCLDPWTDHTVIVKRV